MLLELLLILDPGELLEKSELARLQAVIFRIEFGARGRVGVSRNAGWWGAHREISIGVEWLS
jgi:hypothetical protein